MITYRDLTMLETPVAEQVADLTSWFEALTRLPPGQARNDSLEALYAEAERIEFPQLMAVVKYEETVALLGDVRPQAAVDAYIELIALLGRYADAIHPDLLAAMRAEAPDHVALMMGLPEIPLEVIRVVIDQVGRQSAAVHGSQAPRLLATAMVAACLGDRAATIEGLEAWRASLAAPVDAGVDLTLLDRVDLDAAIALQGELLQALPDGDPAEAFQRITLASRLAQAGRAEEGAAVTSGLWDRLDLEAATGIPDADLLRALEARPDLAGPVVGRVMYTADLHYPGNYPVVAALARQFHLRGEAGDAGAFMRAAQRHAEDLDARNGTTAQADCLRRRWWPGVADGVSPATVTGAEMDIDEVAVRYLDRVAVIPADLPVSLQERCGRSARVAADLLSPPDAAAAERLAELAIGESRILRYPTTEAVALINLALYHNIFGDPVASHETFRRLQEFLGAAGEQVEEYTRDGTMAVFQTVVEGDLAVPEISLEQIRAFIDAQQQLADRLGLASYQVDVCRSLLAAHLGEADELSEEQVRMLAAAERDEAPVGEVEFDVLRGTVRVDAELAGQLLLSFPPELGFANEINARRYGAFRAYLARRFASAEAAAEAAEAILGSVERLAQVASNRVLPYLLSSLDLAPSLEELAPSLEELVRANLPISWEGFPALAGALLRRDPADERGVRLLDEGREIARRLDARNGSGVASAQLASLWL